MAIPGRFGRLELIRMGRNLQGEEMLRAQNLISGKTQPWELPEWQPVTEGLRTQHERGLESLSEAYRQAGVTGPAATLGMERAGEGYEGSLMNIANKMRGMGHEEAWKGAEMGQAESQWLGKMREMRKARKAGEQSDWEKYGSSIMGGASSALGGMGGGGGGGGGCCFIFIEGDLLTDYVRAFRDTHIGINSFISRGYKKMAELLVPKMRSNRFVKWLTKKVMLEPMAKCAESYYQNSKKGWIYVPISIFWLLIWELSGRINDLCCDPSI